MSYVICMVVGLIGGLFASYFGFEAFTFKWFLACLPWWFTGAFLSWIYES